MPEFNDWLSWWRIGLVAMFGTLLLFMLHYFINYRNVWSSRQGDFWFVSVMWFLAAFEMQIEALLRDVPFQHRIIFVTAAGLVSFKIVFSKRNWVVSDE
jgi:hypothetical protein